MNQALPRVGIVVVNWRGLPQTRHCVRSLQAAAAAYPSARIYVVDNGSGDGSEAVIASEFPEVAVVAVAENRGYSAGCNAGIQRAIAEGADYLWILNNDTEADAAAAGTLVQAAEELRTDGSEAILAPKILDGRSGTIWSAGGFLRQPWFKGDHVGLGEPAEAHDEPAEAEWASSCSLFFHRDVIERVGPLPEEYFMYLDDIDWCLRARKAGVLVRYEPGAVIAHGVSEAMRSLDNRHVRYYSYRNYYLLAFRHSGLPGRAWFAAHLLTALAKGAVRWALFPSYRRSEHYNVRTRAIVDFLRGRRGRSPYSDRAQALPSSPAQTAVEA
ncbi:MAG TPA: glycosyltransferase family 2 protein [Dehalococcoidia bacterium]